MPEIRYVETTRLLRLTIAQYLWIPRRSAGQYQFRQPGQRNYKDRSRADWLEVSRRLELKVWMRVELLTDRVGLIWGSRAHYSQGKLVAPNGVGSADPKPSAANQGTIITVSRPALIHVSCARARSGSNATVPSAGRRPFLRRSVEEEEFQIGSGRVQQDHRCRDEVCGAQSARRLGLQEGEIRSCPSRLLPTFFAD